MLPFGYFGGPQNIKFLAETTKIATVLQVNFFYYTFFRRPVFQIWIVFRIFSENYRVISLKSQSCNTIPGHFFLLYSFKNRFSKKEQHCLSDIFDIISTKYQVFSLNSQSCNAIPGQFVSIIFFSKTSFPNRNSIVFRILSKSFLQNIKLSAWTIKVATPSQVFFFYYTLFEDKFFISE